ncbi:transmembrane protein [Ceratobasidium sp. AG-Ba]|nr:transmembrane protein [Ceratobasidium sp. AG-Ba]
MSWSSSPGVQPSSSSASSIPTTSSSFSLSNPTTLSTTNTPLSSHVVPSTTRIHSPLAVSRLPTTSQTSGIPTSSGELLSTRRRIQESTSNAPDPTITPAPDNPTPDPDDPDESNSGGLLSATCQKIGNIKCAYTQVIVGETAVVPTGNPFLMPVPTTSFWETNADVFTTLLHIETTAVVPVPTIIRVPVFTRATLTESGSQFIVVPVPTTLTDSLGVPVVTSTLNAAVIPTFSTVTDRRGSVVGTSTFDLTTTIPIPTPTSPPEILFTLTSWTTYMTVSGSTVPAIAGQVGVLTTKSETYVLGPSTTAPLDAFSSIHVEATGSSLPPTSPPNNPDTTSKNKASAVAAAIVGTLVAVTLLGVLFWVIRIKYRRKQRRASDYAGYQSPLWGSRSVDQTISRDQSILDLDGEPQPRGSLVEPWIQGRQPLPTSRKMQREMEERGERLMVVGSSRGASTIGPSVAHNAPQSSKSTSRVHTEVQSESTPRSHASPSIHLAQNPPLPPIAQPTPTPPQPRPEPHSVRYDDNGERIRDPAIPPMYNEAWNIRRPPPSE